MKNDNGYIFHFIRGKKHRRIINWSLPLNLMSCNSSFIWCNKKAVAMYMHELDIDLRIFCLRFLPHNFPRPITRNNPLNVVYLEPSTWNTDKLYKSKYQLIWGNGLSYSFYNLRSDWMITVYTISIFQNCIDM